MIHGNPRHIWTLKRTLGFILLSGCLCWADVIRADGHSPARVLSYELDVSFMPQAELSFSQLIEALTGEVYDDIKNSTQRFPYMEGSAAVTVDLGSKPINRLTFFLHSELRVSAVRIENRELSFTQDREYYRYSYTLLANRVDVQLPRASGRVTLRFEYAGFFHRSFAGSTSNYMRLDRDGVFLRSHGYSLWFPTILNDKERERHRVDFNAVRITTPKKLRAVFTGQRLREFNQRDKRISEWQAKQIHVNQAQCTARPFLLTKQSGLHLYYLNHPQSKATARGIRRFSSRLLSLFTERYRPIQTTPQYHIAELPVFGDISSGNMIGLTSHTWRNFNAHPHYKITIAHEYVHPFVHHVVPQQDPLFALNIEGFPSYFHLPVLAEIFGQQWYQERMRQIEQAYLKRRKTGLDRRGNPLPREKPIAALTAGDISIYKDTFILNDRCPLFLNYLQKKMGQTQFLKFCTALFAKQNLTMNGFKQLIEHYLPGSAKDVSIWLEGNDYPTRFHL